MPAITSAQLVMAVVTLLASIGLVFEIGRRIGRGAEQRDQTDTSVGELEVHIEESFNNLERKIDHESATREREHELLVDWLGTLTERLQGEGYDVDKPDEVSQRLDIGPHDRDRYSDGD